MANVARQLRQISQRTGKDLLTVVKETNVQLFTSIILKTPVDKGRLIAGWVALINQEPEGTSEAVDKTGGIALNAARVTSGAMKIGDEFWFVNLVPYATYLENGTDRTAPVGMVKLSIRDIQRIVKQKASGLL